MRILYVSSSGALGGAERVLLDLAAGMRVRGHDVRVLSGEDGALVERARELGEVDVLEFPRRFAVLGESGRSRAAVALGLPLVAVPVARYLRRIRQALGVWTPAIVHSHGTKAHVLAAWAGLPGAVVWHLHEYVGARPVSARLLRASADRAAAAIAISQSVAADYAAAVPRHPVWTVLNAVDLERFAPDGHRIDLDRAASLPSAPPGTVRVGLVATFAWWKGHDVFLRAMARVPGDLAVRGYIVGGPLYQTGGASQLQQSDLAASADALGLKDRVGLTGFIDDVPGVMRSLDVVVHASTRPEPFGLAIAEAMACGRPVVVSAAGGAAEIVRDGVDALTAVPGDDAALAQRIVALCADAAARDALGRAARAAACERFDRARMLDGVEAVYARVRQEAA